LRKIAIANRKGGVGKTTTAVNISHGLALTGHKVLLVDTDTQGHCSILLGVNPQLGLADLINRECEPSEALIEAREGLFLLAGGKKVGEIERYISRQTMQSEYMLAEALESYENGYDFVILDTAPGFTMMSVNVMFYAHEVIVPVSMEGLALESLKALDGEIDVYRKYADVNISYIVPTFYDLRTKKTVEVLGILKTHFQERLTHPIRYDVKVSDSTSWGQTIYDFVRKSRAREDYAILTETIA
jgi:chromosome partitioning protein